MLANHSISQTFSLLIKMTRREFKSGAYKLTLFALTLAVTVVCALSLTSSRIENAMTRQAADLNGGDLVIRSTTVPTDEMLALADKHQLEQSLSVRTQTMIGFDDRFQLSRVRAVDDDYPLKGKVSIRQQLNGPSILSDKGPSVGEAWADKPLFQKLNLNIGDVIQIGAASFILTKVLELEPDQSGSFYSLFPKVMIHLDDLDSTQLIQPGSRIRVKQMVAMSEDSGQNISSDALQNWQQDIIPFLSANQRISTAKDRQNRLGKELQKASAFINLGSLMSVILCGIAVSLAATRHAIKHINQVALIRCLGVRASKINKLYMAQLLLLTLLASIVGMMIGFFIHQLLISFINELFITVLPSANIVAWFSGPLVALIMIVGFGLPPILKLAQTPPAKIFRSNTENQPIFVSKSSLIAILSLIVIAWWQTKQLSLALLTIGSVTVLIAFLMWLNVSLFKLFPKEKINHPLIRNSYGNITNRPWLSSLQIVGFGLSIFAIAFILYFRTDLINQWDEEIPSNAPNRFAFDIQSAQIDEFKSLMRENNLDNPLYPVTRGRLTSINGDVVQTAVTKESDNETSESNEVPDEEALRRDLALTQFQQLPFENTLTKGQWIDSLDDWNAQQNNASLKGNYPVSVEAELAKNLNLNLGDSLSFFIEGREINATVTSFREVNWENFQPNFYFIFPVGALEGFSQTWLTSFYLSASQIDLENIFNQRFVGTSIVNVEDILKRIRQILNQVSSAMELIFAMTLLAGLAIFWAAFLIAMDEKQQQTALLRALGASRNGVIKRFVLEHFLIGLFASILSIACLLGVSWSVSYFILEMNWSLSWQFWVFLPLMLTGSLSLLSYWQCRKIINQPPLRVLLSAA